MSYDNTNRGSIWKNDRKEKDTHPDFRGEANVDGAEFWVSAWKRKPDANPKAPALTFALTPKQERQGGGDPKPSRGNDDFDDDIPFITNDINFDPVFKG